jgi:hypothetical protein
MFCFALLELLDRFANLRATQLGYFLQGMADFSFVCARSAIHNIALM